MPTTHRIVFTLACAFASTAVAQTPCPAVNDVLVTNGVVHTMDANDTIVESVRVVGDRVAAVGSGRLGATRCTRVIDVDGRTVVPGLIDNHNHIVLLGLRPGHDTRLESAASIEDVVALVAARAADLPQGEWITSIGGFDINQFVPPPDAPRFPTLAELDTAAPEHPVYIQQSFAGPSVTNSLGKRFFENAGTLRAAQTPNARRSEARHTRRAALRRELRHHDAFGPRRFPGHGHGGRRCRALRPLSRV